MRLRRAAVAILILAALPATVTLQPAPPAPAQPAEPNRDLTQPGLGVRGSGFGSNQAPPTTALQPEQSAQPPPLARHLPPAGSLSPRNANYSIDVRLDPRSRTLAGREIVTWRNVSGVSATELQFHLYWNAWKNTRSSWMQERLLSGRPARNDLASRPAEDWSWIEVNAIRLLDPNGQFLDLTSEKRYISPDDGNADDRTVLAVPLPQPVGPGQAVTLDMSFTSKIPRTFSRTGTIGDYFFIVQWFPKLGVLEDDGWNCHQFHAGTEFFADYGVYDVRMTVPQRWILGATGRERERRDNADGTTTHRYYQEDVHDFAWTTSPDYLERRQKFEHASLPVVDMRLLLQREHEAQAERHFTATRAALRWYGDWYGPYPYGHVTIVDPAWQSGAGGMEYPTLFTAGTAWLVPARVMRPEGVTVHEAGHQFWYGIVGNNEFEHAWLDEGLNTFSTARVIEREFEPNYFAKRYFGGFIPYVFRDIRIARATDGNRLSGYRSAARMDAQSTPSYRYWPATGSNITYNKTALWLHTLERYLGWPTLQKILATFFDRWKFRHPKPDDFFAVASEVSGRDLTWFFDQTHRSSNVFDYGVQELTSKPAATRGFVERRGKLEFSDAASPARFEATVVVRRYGEAIFPVEVVVGFENGELVRELWDGRDRWKLFTYERPAKATFAQVDPGRTLLLDVNYTNNSWTLRPVSDAAATKWMLKWIVWLQDLMLTYGFFV